MEEKRKYQRYPVYRATEIRSKQARTRLGVTQDMSRCGARVLTRAPLDAGAEVELRIALADYDDATECSAKVVRILDLPDKGQLWRREVSLEFFDILPELIESQLHEGEEGTTSLNR